MRAIPSKEYSVTLYVPGQLPKVTPDVARALLAILIRQTTAPAADEPVGEVETWRATRP